MLNTHRHLPLGLAGHKYQMNFISDVVINLLAYRVGVCVLGFLSDGRFQGERGFAWGCSVAVGGLVLLAPFMALIAGIIHTRER